MSDRFPATLLVRVGESEAVEVRYGGVGEDGIAVYGATVRGLAHEIRINEAALEHAFGAQIVARKADQFNPADPTLVPVVKVSARGI